MMVNCILGYAVENSFAMLHCVFPWLFADDKRLKIQNYQIMTIVNLQESTMVNNQLPASAYLKVLLSDLQSPTYMKVDKVIFSLSVS